MGDVNLGDAPKVVTTIPDKKLVRLERRVDSDGKYAFSWFYEEEKGVVVQEVKQVEAVKVVSAKRKKK